MHVKFIHEPSFRYIMNEEQLIKKNSLIKMEDKRKLSKCGNKFLFLKIVFYV